MRFVVSVGWVVMVTSSAAAGAESCDGGGCRTMGAFAAGAAPCKGEPPGESNSSYKTTKRHVPSKTKSPEFISVK